MNRQRYNVFDCTRDHGYALKGLRSMWVAELAAMVLTAITGRMHDYDGAQV